MNYLNLHTDQVLRSQEYLGAEPVERATWLNLMAWCASQENGGVIENIHDWTDRKLQQVLGITKEEATLVSELYPISEDGVLTVTFYPNDKETEVKDKREVARKNGKKGGRPQKKHTEKTKPENPEKPTSVISENPNKPTLVIFEKAERERKEKEKDKEKRNGMESKEPPTPLGDLLPYDSDSFREAWESWKIHRAEIRKKLTPSTIRAQLSKLAKLNDEMLATDTIINSITNGYTGLFPPSENKNSINPAINKKGKSQYA